LHYRAGSVSVLELHGNIHRTRCSIEGVVVEGHDEDDAPPQCPACGGWLRPDVVWFGEMLDAWILGEAERRASECDVFISVGTSAQVYPAAALPQTAKRAGAALIEINIDDTALSSHADYVLREPATSGVAQLEGLLNTLGRRSG